MAREGNKRFSCCFEAMGNMIFSTLHDRRYIAKSDGSGVCGCENWNHWRARDPNIFRDISRISVIFSGKILPALNLCEGRPDQRRFHVTEASYLV